MTLRGLIRTVTTLLFLGAVGACGEARASEPETSRALNPQDVQLFEDAVASLKKGAPTEAIGQFELLADRGVLHPDISFDRALAYYARATSPQAKPGDLGRTAYALAETLVQNPHDRAASALESVVARDLSRARSRRGAPSLLARARLSRAIVGLLSEDTWALSAMFWSLTLTLGIVLRFGTQTHRKQLTGAVALGLGLGLGLLSCLGLWLSMRERRDTWQGVVVSTEARLLDVAGAPLPRGQSSAQDRLIPEGARVLVSSRTGRLLQVEWGGTDGYVSPTELQILPRLP